MSTSYRALGRPVIGTDLAIVSDVQESAYASALSRSLNTRNWTGSALDVAVSSHELRRAHCWVVVEVDRQPSETLKAWANRLVSSGQPVVLVRILAEPPKQYWSDLVAGVDPIPETTQALSAASPSQSVLDRIEGALSYARTMRGIQRVSSATLCFALGCATLAVWLATLAVRAKAAELSSEVRATVVQTAANEAEAAAKIAAEKKQAAQTESEAAERDAAVAERTAVVYGGQLDAIRDFFKRKPSLPDALYTHGIDFGVRRGDEPPQGGQRWFHFSLQPAVVSLPAEVRPLSFTFYHAVGTCSSHLLEASEGPVPAPFEYDGFGCYRDVRVLFLGQAGGIVAAKTSFCPPDAKPMVCN